jgi:dihydrofolate reductase
MRKLVTAAFISLDGVMQAPGGPQEDPTGGFRHGGWIVPHASEATGKAIGDLFARPFELVLGRRTYDIFAAYWPYFPTDPAAPGYNEGGAGIAAAFNRTAKHVATHRPDSLAWENSTSLGPDVVAAVRALKAQDGPMLLTQGSADLVQTLSAADLIDEYRLQIFPVVLGRGRRLFGERSTPGALTMTRSVVAPNGVVIATYERAGAVRTGSFAG